MANTSVFTLGVTAPQPLGSVVDALRQSLERLRSQADDTRLGRLIGEVIRLGLELDKVRLVERQLTTEQAWAHEEQIDRLRREGDEVERLRRRYLSLGRKPIVLTTIYLRVGFNDGAGSAPQTASPVTPENESPSPDASGSEPGAEPSEPTGSGRQAKTWVVLGSIGSGLAGVLAYGGYRKLPGHLKTSVREAADEGAPTAIGKGLLALGEEKGEDKAKGLGAAFGELAGGVLGTLLGAVTKNERAKKYGGKIGELLGENLGGAFGTFLYDEVYAEPAGKDKPADGSKASGASTAEVKAKRTAASGAKQEQVEEEEEEEEEEEQLEAKDSVSSRPSESAGLMSTASSAVLGATSLLGMMGKAGASPAGASLTGRVLRRLPGMSQLTTGLQLAETYNSDATAEQKLEGYGTAVGGLGGGLAGAAVGAAVGSVVPVIGTAIGGLIGGVLGSMGGESLGGLLGKALGAGKDDPPTQPAMGNAARALDTPAAPANAQVQPAQTAAPAPPVNQQFTFNANVPVTFTNSLSDPSVVQQLEAMMRRQLDELMRQARSVQMTDTSHVAL
ncbi:hypothetical protein N5F23_06375 [Pseudomonas sichuanensis]|uniref:hypothetical protein n=1 Tax=Pseudomonas sichuanensis TaxID=2213015 RepID=UPI00244A2EFB|nr:hypothetical protein [Pseudomonas sichuanensis]MDH0729628.1 hypothetical protein [Pseudomonas sichuanensis]MDH1582215.1 hypothetical protein [Pseudomonas sichuanensis]MDH1591320.1 hypothetical protein [Pseudomonas sichuanensis]MDH1596922.1 hypothetical protein [Pseudomonas sichuanensis]